MSDAWKKVRKVEAKNKYLSRNNVPRIFVVLLCNLFLKTYNGLMDEKYTSRTSRALSSEIEFKAHIANIFITIMNARALKIRE